MAEIPILAPAGSGAWRRGFWALIATQFQGAFSDNALKNLVILLVLGMGISHAQKDRLVPCVLLLFAAPFILFSMAGGYLADRFSKREVTIATKWFELGVAFLALAGLTSSSLPLEFTAIFFLSASAAIFGPAKYGLLPELLPAEKLSWGNGVLELGTFLAIITGTIAAGYMSEGFSGRQYNSGLVLVGLILIGISASFGISHVPAWNPAQPFRVNFLADFLSEVRGARSDRKLFAALWANTFFWFLGGLLQPIILLYGKEVLQLSDAHNTWLQASLAIGIGLGSLAAGYLSGGKIEYGLAPFGALGLAGFSIALARPGLGFAGFASRLAITGFFAGFFAVPINALLQHRPDPARKGALLAAANLLSFVGVFLAGVAYYALVSLLNFSPRQVFLAGAVFSELAFVYLRFSLPDSLFRMLLWAASHCLYRIRVTGRVNVPARGGVIFFAPSLSLEQALLLCAASERSLYFHGSPKIPWLAWLQKASGLGPPKSATNSPLQVLARGEALCVTSANTFPEDAAAAPVLAVTVACPQPPRVEFRNGRLRWHLAGRFFRPATIAFGPRAAS